MSLAESLLAEVKRPDVELSQPVASGAGAIARAARMEDVEQLAALFLEMQSHYGQPVTPAEAVAAAELACRCRAGLFDPYTILAFRGSAVVGSVVLNVTFPATVLTRSLYVRDLYVASVARRQGVGQVLLAAACQTTISEGYSALDWTTSATNASARAMYDMKGAALLDRVYYRLTREFLESNECVPGVFAEGPEAAGTVALGIE